MAEVVCVLHTTCEKNMKIGSVLVLGWGILALDWFVSGCIEGWSGLRRAAPGLSPASIDSFDGFRLKAYIKGEYMKRNFSGSKEMPRNAVVRLTPIAAAAGLLVLSASYSAMAQDATVTSKDAKADEPQTVQVQGIRAALQQSLTQKKNADSHVEVITAEDIGKMPDKNVADSLERVPGVTVSNAGASEGGFDENDRFSMRCTNSNLTQTLINGHNVTSGDWFVLNQTTQVGRSVSYTLVPSELVGSVVVHKSSEANLV